MKASIYLNQIIRLEQKIRHAKEEIARRRDLVSSPTIAGEMKKDKIQTSLNLHRWEDAVVDIECLNNKLAIMINSYIAKREQIIRQIDEIETPLHAEILRGYYLQKKSLKQIAEENGYSHDHVRHAHSLALKEFDKKFLNGNE